MTAPTPRLRMPVDDAIAVFRRERDKSVERNAAAKAAKQAECVAAWEQAKAAEAVAKRGGRPRKLKPIRVTKSPRTKGPQGHGTVWCYRHGCRLPECVAANTEYHRAYYEANKVKRQAQVREAMQRSRRKARAA